MHPPILPEGSLTFADYFKLSADVEEVLAEFDYSFRMESCEHPRGEVDVDRIAEVKRHFEQLMPHVVLTSEMARREFLIAPVLGEVALFTDAKIKVEVPLQINERLQGTLDYLIRARHNLLVVAAKNADVTRGFKQLAVELVALDCWAQDSPEPRLYGAVSVGDSWKFGYLDREEKRLIEDLNVYGIPTQLLEIVRILVGVLTV
ncbi:MAG: hypothetical protein GY856_29350 [bacterium]|nr:hypothetical protein [bacterium]